MARYRTKSCEIEAIQWTDNTNEIKSFCGNSCTYSVEEQCMGSWKGIPIERLVIHTLEGDMVVSRNDYIIKGLKGEFYPCKPDVFNQKYKLINDTMEIQEEQRWIPVTERLPEELTPVNITWINRNPEQYYADIKDVPFPATGVFHRGKWYWWSVVVVDYLSEYGRYDMDLVDKDIEIVAWQPLPEPYKG